MQRMQRIAYSADRCTRLQQQQQCLKVGKGDTEMAVMQGVQLLNTHPLLNPHAGLAWFMRCRYGGACVAFSAFVSLYLNFIWGLG